MTLNPWLDPRKVGPVVAAASWSLIAWGLPFVAGACALDLLVRAERELRDASEGER